MLQLLIEAIQFSGWDAAWVAKARELVIEAGGEIPGC
jgi:hypothetical protein